MSSWEPWQEEYRYGAFYLFPPHDVSRELGELRWHHDPTSAAICDAHVSLTEPLHAPLTDQVVEEVREALSSLPSFEVSLGPPTQLGTHPGVVLAVSPPERVMELRTVLHATSLFEGRELARAPRTPHVTIAEFIERDAADVLLATLRAAGVGGEFLCDRVTYAVPDESFHFAAMLEIPLGGGRP